MSELIHLSGAYEASRSQSVRDPLAFLLGSSDLSSRHRRRWARELGSHLLDAVTCVALPEVLDDEEDDESSLFSRRATINKEA